MAGQPGRSGGARAKAGRPRKSKAERFAKEIEAAEIKIAANMPELLERLLELASGGYEKENLTYEAAATLFRTEYEEIFDDEGRATGRSRKLQIPIFPGDDPERMILVRRVVTTADRNYGAITYLMDRILGRPASEDESDKFLTLIDEFKTKVIAAVEKVEDKSAQEQFLASLKRI